MTQKKNMLGAEIILNYELQKLRVAGFKSWFNLSDNSDKSYSHVGSVRFRSLKV
jgi:hypothetical protein